MILPLDSDLKPVIDRSYWEEISASPQMQADERMRCSVEPYYWLVNFVYTIRKDENTEGGVIERFPADEYLQYVFHKLFTEPLFAADKSRQVRLSWILMAWAVWLCQYRMHEQIICQSKERTTADQELIKRRAETIWKYQPSWLKPNAEYISCYLRFPATDSEIIAIAAGDKAGDKIRAFNPTRVILDEGGFYEGKFEECRTTALACCNDIKCVSTANSGQWEDFVENDDIAA